MTCSVSVSPTRAWALNDLQAPGLVEQLLRRCARRMRLSGRLLEWVGRARSQEARGVGVGQ